MTLILYPSTDVPVLLARLRDADEDFERILAALRDEDNTAYLIQYGELIIGAVVLRWNPDSSEVLYIAIEKAQRGQGFGKNAMAQIIRQAQRREVDALLVGTANSSLDNLAFYQKCGFRFDSIRKDYFANLDPPVYENGIRMCDMIVVTPKSWTQKSLCLF